MINVTDRGCRENQNAQFMFRTFFSENHTVYEIVWKNMVEQDRPQITV